MRPDHSREGGHHENEGFAVGQPGPHGSEEVQPGSVPPRGAGEPVDIAVRSAPIVSDFIQMTFSGILVNSMRP